MSHSYVHIAILKLCVLSRFFWHMPYWIEPASSSHQNLTLTFHSQICWWEVYIQFRRCSQASKLSLNPISLNRLSCLSNLCGCPKGYVSFPLVFTRYITALISTAVFLLAHNFVQWCILCRGSHETAGKFSPTRQVQVLPHDKTTQPCILMTTT